MIRQHLKGRLGNVMFEVATAYAYALDHDMPFTISNTTKDPVMQPLYFQHLVNPAWDVNKPGKWIREMQHNYKPLPWDESWRNYNIEMMGFWQSEKYFKHRKDEVVKLFDLGKWTGKNIFRQSVSIHVRRGDYLTIPGKHIDNTGAYMKNAIDMFKGAGFAVFSDDIEWCKNYFSQKFPDEHFYYSDNHNPLVDIGLMASCWHFINSSSTFSWWGAWLGMQPGKIIVTPKEWFQSTQPEDTSDIIPESWIKL